MKSPATRLARVSRWMSVVAVMLSGPVAGAELRPEPRATLDRLRDGNDRFVRTLAGAATAAIRLRATPADRPSAAVLSCADAGRAPEQVFDTAPGEIVSVRVGGPAADKVVVASLEQAVERHQVSVVVVMGHEVCDTLRAVSATAPRRVRTADPIAAALAPAMTRAALRADLDAREGAVQAAVEQTVNDVLRASELLRQHVTAGDLAVVGAYYEADSGRVVFSRPVERVPVPNASPSATR
jgi:carbonic anhydrase